MDLLLTIVVLGALAAWTGRRGQMWVPVLCLVLIGMSLVSGTVRGVVRTTTTTVIDGGSTVVSSIAAGLSRGGK